MKSEQVNGYANEETYSLSLWLHNDEYINNELLPNLLAQADGNKIQAGEYLKQSFHEREDSFIADVMGKDFYRRVADDVGSFWRVEWEEMFDDDMLKWR